MKKKRILLLVVLCLSAIAVSAAVIWMHFGGFDTEESTAPAVFAACAEPVETISIPENARIIALGEATHGNGEFQQLKLDLFRLLVEQYGVRAFALEGDYGGCEQVNRYIHGGEGTAREAAAAIGFAIYRTKEMAELISFMRQYNDNAADGDDLRFYGFDMQRCGYSFTFLMQDCSKLGVDTEDLEKLVNGEDWSDGYTSAARMKIITRVKAGLESRNGSAKAVHFADVLLQNGELSGTTAADCVARRDRLMAENVQWIAKQEQDSGFGRIFVSAHNGHVARWGSYDSMGKLLSGKMAGAYYVIGTDFYKTCCNMPRQPSGRRTNQVFYSHDPLAKLAKSAGLDICWLSFAKASNVPELAALISKYTYMGSLGEGYAWYMRLLPQSYRIFQPPAELYDGMILVADAHPTVILSEK
jgi:erythromycin esterase